MSTVTIANTDAQLTGVTLVDASSTQTITGAKSFNRSPNPPFAVQSASAKVSNLNADQVDGIDVTVANGNRLLYSTSATAIGEFGALTNGQLAIGSTGAAPVGAALTAGAGISVTNGAGSITLASQFVLLKAGSGTDSSAGATNVDTIALASGLTAKDRLIVEWEMKSVGAAAASFQLYSSTDSVILATVGPGSGETFVMHSKLAQSQASATVYNAQLTAWGTIAGATVGGVNGPVSMATAWTGAWTLALRHGGISGGSVQWSWAVYRFVGQ